LIEYFISKNETKFKLLKSAFVEDKKLYLKKSTCWVQPLHQLKGLLNLQSLDISFFVNNDLSDLVKLNLR
jgi:hypothetical protein